MIQFYKTFFSCLAVTILLAGCNAHPQSSTEETSGYALSAGDINPVLTGTAIPNVWLRTTGSDTVKLRELVTEQPAVLVFYRGGWCPYCNRHLAELAEIEDEIREMGYRFFAVSPDRPEKLKESIQKHDLGYTLLSDSPMTVSKAFGLAYKVDEETVLRYKQNEMDLEESSGYDHHLLPVPAVYIINTEGTIQFQYVNPDYRTRIKSEVLLAAAKAYIGD